MLTEEHFNQRALTVGLTFEDSTAMASIDISEEMNHNLTAPQRELLMWHQKWAHCDLGRVQTLLAKPRDVATSQLVNPKDEKASSYPKPKCAAYCLSKTGRSSARTATVVDSSNRNLNNDTTSPGDVVHLDQYMYGLPGRLPHTYGKEKPKVRFTGGTIFIDEKTGFIHHHHQVSLRVGETLKGKNMFEKGASQLEVYIRTFKADKAPFSSVEFNTYVANKGQEITFSGVGAHHQNGVAERAIKTIISWARTMMLHAILHWPEQTTLDLWPFTMDHAAYCRKHLPNKAERIAPLEAFTGAQFSNYEHLMRLHVWGSLCYVLDPHIQDEKKIPKWEPRCRQGQYL
jgi:hypothetical protein